MSRLESAAKIEVIVGAKRHPTDHIGRAVSAEQRVYILHSAECVATTKDLRDCEYSYAMDLGIHMELWEEHQDVAVVLAISDEYEDLEPARRVDESEVGS